MEGKTTNKKIKKENGEKKVESSSSSFVFFLMFLALLLGFSFIKSKGMLDEPSPVTPIMDEEANIPTEEVTSTPSSTQSDTHFFTVEFPHGTFPFYYSLSRDSLQNKAVNFCVNSGKIQEEEKIVVCANQILTEVLKIHELDELPVLEEELEEGSLNEQQEEEGKKSDGSVIGHVPITLGDNKYHLEVLTTSHPNNLAMFFCQEVGLAGDESCIHLVNSEVSGLINRYQQSIQQQQQPPPTQEQLQAQQQAQLQAQQQEQLQAQQQEQQAQLQAQQQEQSEEKPQESV